MKSQSALLLAGLLLLTVAGCSSTGSSTQPAAVEDVTTPGAITPGQPAEPSALGLDSSVVGGDLGPDVEPNTPLGQRVIYFAHDQATVQAQYRPIIEAHARYLRERPRLIVTLQGHTDPQGSREYNIALGERRGEAVRRLMQLQGAGPAQLSVVSYGEERPAVEGDGEAAWSKDRRVLIVYTGERP